MIIEKITIKKKNKFDERFFDTERYTRYIISRKEKRRLYNSKKDTKTLKRYGFVVETGIPDFFYIEDKKINFIECKHEKDGLKFNQFKWVCNHPSVNIRIVFLNVIDVKTKKEDGNIVGWEKYYIN